MELVVSLAFTDGSEPSLGIDDYTAKEMGAEMVVHYGHSCLSTITQIIFRGYIDDAQFRYRRLH